MKILVTGGAGYVGSNLCNKLTEENHEVICLDYDFNQDFHIRPEATKFLHDIKRNLPTDFLNTNIEYIFHLAALPRIATSFENAGNVIETNANGTLKILEAARVFNCPINFISSSSVKSNLYANPYTYSKIMAEQHCVFYHVVFGLPVIITRLFNVYGNNHPRTGPKACLLGILEDNILENKQTVIFGDGEQKRDFTHVEDICEGLIKTMNCKHIGQKLDLGYGHSHTVNEVLKILNINNIIRLEKRRGDGIDTLADVNHTRQFIDWTPKNSLSKYIKIFMNKIM